jgi:hypothetical protein
MEKIGLVFIVLSLFGYLLNDDILSHIMGSIFFSIGVSIYLLTLKYENKPIFTEELVAFLFLVLNMMIITGLFIYKDHIKTDKVDEIK